MVQGIFLLEDQRKFTQKGPNRDEPWWMGGQDPAVRRELTAQQEFLNTLVSLKV